METSQVNRLILEVTRLGNQMDEVMGMLAAQQKVLKMRGMQLPPNVMERLDSVQQEVNQLRQMLGDQTPELTQLRALFRTIIQINSSLDLQQVLNEVMDTFVELTGAERGLILLINPDTRDMEIKVLRGMDQETMSKGSFNVSRTVVREVASKGQPIVATNALEDERLSAQESIISYAVRSIICVPLKVKDEIIGVAYSDHRYRKELFGEQELRSLVAFANQAAIAIENARLFENLQQRLAEVTEIRNFLDNIFNSIISGVITLNEDGIVITTNPAAEHILGIKAHSSYGKYYTEVFPTLFEGFEELLNRVLTQGKQQVTEINPVLSHRGSVYLKLSLTPLRDWSTQDINGVTIVIDDLTELKQRDETLRVVNTYLSAEMVANIQSLDQIGLGGEDREITAIFADVRGFTTFSEKLDPEVLMSIINQYLAVSSNAVQDYQGVIDKFMGDAVLGLYNTQLNPQDDHAIRCVMSAIKIVQDVDALHQKLPANYQLRYGIGIHTGPATIGNIGSASRKEFTAIGEAVDYAKKYQETASGGEIVISPATYEQIKHAVDCEPIERQLRNSEEVVSLYRVIGIKS